MLSSLLLMVAVLAPSFKDVTETMGLAIGTDQACWVDMDNDGWTDLCVSGFVWRNEKGKKFTKGFDCGMVVAGDFDNDGFADLFSWSRLKAYRNLKGKGFEEVAMPKLPPTVSRGACLGDFDSDGFLDVYVGGYEDWEKQLTYPSMLLRNVKGKGFEIGMTDARYRARGVTACDFNQDLEMDIYVSNYRLQPNVLWRNQGGGKFIDVAADFGVTTASPGFDGGHSIGACWGDFDNDGVFDLFAGSFAHRDARGDQPKSRFLRNLGPLKRFRFEDKGECGLAYQESYASPAAGDYDNDGDLDLFFTTVYQPASFGVKNYPVLYRNESGFKFVDVSAETGVGGLPPTYQAAWADFDRDGRLDLIGAGKLFRNVGAGGNWLEVRLKGKGSGIGAQVRVSVGGKVIARQVEAGTGEGNQNDLVLHFGLGKTKGKVDFGRALGFEEAVDQGSASGESGRDSSLACHPFVVV